MAGLSGAAAAAVGCRLDCALSAFRCAAPPAVATAATTTLTRAIGRNCWGRMVQVVRGSAGDRGSELRVAGGGGGVPATRKELRGVGRSITELLGCTGAMGAVRDAVERADQNEGGTQAGACWRERELIAAAAAGTSTSGGRSKSSKPAKGAVRLARHKGRGRSTEAEAGPIHPPCSAWCCSAESGRRFCIDPPSEAGSQPVRLYGEWVGLGWARGKLEIPMQQQGLGLRRR